jgi:hypothetical protein
MLREPAVIDVQGEPGTEPNIVQRVIEVDAIRRTQLLRHLLKQHEGEWDRVLVFVATQHAAQIVAEKLYKNGIYAVPFHGDIAQGTRTDILSQFKQSRWDVVIATDLAARGIDIAQLPVVINYDLPRSPTDYIHRIGRTGRAGESGLAISFVSASTEAHFRVIEKRQGLSLPRERIEGFEPTEAAVPVTDASGTGGIKGKRPSKKDKLRAAAKAAQGGARTAKAAKAKRTAESTAQQRRTNAARRHSVHRVVDLVPRDAQVAQLFTHAQMRRMRRIAVERGLAVELAVQHHVAGVAHAARIGTHFQVQQPRDLPAQRFELALEQRAGLRLVFGRVAAQVPHDDVLEHGGGAPAHSTGAKPAFCGHRLLARSAAGPGLSRRWKTKITRAPAAANGRPMVGRRDAKRHASRPSRVKNSFPLAQCQRCRRDGGATRSPAATASRAAWPPAPS